MNGDSLTELKKLEKESIQTVVTSPPYWGLRDYGTADWDGGDKDCEHKPVFKPHPSATVGNDIKDIGKSYYRDYCKDCGAKRIDDQIGIESTPKEYVQNMVNLFKEIRRVLKKDGTVWLNLGDSYIGGGKGWEWSKEGTIQKNHIDAGVKYDKPTGKIEGLKPKDLAGIPWRVAFALQEDGWWLRSDIIWHKPNPMPESVQDRPTKSHEYIFLLTKSPHYYYDADAIREPHTWGESKPRPSGMERNAQKYRDKVYGGGGSGFAGHSGTRKADGSSLNHPLGKNKRTVWTEDDKNIKGNMSERGVTRTTEGLNLKSSDEKRHPLGKNKRSVWTVNTKPYPEAHFAVYPEKLVKDCVLAGSKDEDLVLDPFSGSGTTGLVACKNNRNYIGIELSEDYAQLSMRRLASEVGATEEQSKLIKTDGVQSGLFL